MSDIFISYASVDRARAQQLATALERQGWSVLWDRQIPPGKTFDQVVEEELNAARCVVVLWSQAAVSSRWVKAEASEGAQREVLVPVLIDDVRIPLEFRRIQAARLVNWQETGPHPEFDKLLRAIKEILGLPSIPKLTPQSSSPEAGWVQPSIPPKGPLDAGALSFFLPGLGQMYLGQCKKGFTLLGLAFFCALITAGGAWVICMVVAAIDAYLIGSKLKHGHPVRRMEYCWDKREQWGWQR